MDRTVTVWNPASERIFGWTAEEVIGQPMPPAMIPDDERESSAERIRTHDRRRADPGRPRAPPHEGRPRGLDRDLWLGAPWTADGRPIGVAGSAGRRHRAGRDRGPARPRGAARGDRAARRRHRPRLQQHAHGDRRLRGAHRRRDRRPGRRPRGRRDHRRRRRAIAASSRASSSRSPAGRRSSRRRRHPDRRRHGRADAPPPARRPRGAARSGRPDDALVGARRRRPARAGPGQPRRSTPATRWPTAGRSPSAMRRVRVAAGDVADEPDVVGAVRRRRACATPARAWTPDGRWRACSSRSSRPRSPAAARASAWRWSATSCASRAARVRLASTPGAGTTVELLFPELVGARARRTRRRRSARTGRPGPSRSCWSTTSPPSRRSPAGRSTDLGYDVRVGERRGVGDHASSTPGATRSTSCSRDLVLPDGTRHGPRGRGSRRSRPGARPCSCAGTRPTPSRTAASGSSGSTCSASRTTASSSPRASGARSTPAPDGTDGAAPGAVEPRRRLRSRRTRLHSGRDAPDERRAMAGDARPGQPERARRCAGPSAGSRPRRAARCATRRSGASAGSCSSPGSGRGRRTRSCASRASARSRSRARAARRSSCRCCSRTSAARRRSGSASARPSSRRCCTPSTGSRPTAITEHEGVVDKFVGDEAIGLFIPGFAGRDHAAKAHRGRPGAAGSRRAGPTPRRTARSRSAPASTPASPTSAAWARATRSRTSPRSGDVVNSTARLASLAAAGELLVSTGVGGPGGPRARTAWSCARSTCGVARRGSTCWSSDPPAERPAVSPGDRGQNARRRMIRPMKMTHDDDHERRRRHRRHRVHGVVDRRLDARPEVLRAAAPAERAAGARRLTDPLSVLDHARIFAPGRKGFATERCHNPQRWPRRRSSPGRRPPTRWPPVARRSSGTTGAPRTTSSGEADQPASLGGRRPRVTLDGGLLLGRGRGGQGSQGAGLSRVRRRGQSPPRGLPGARHRPRARVARAAIRSRRHGCARPSASSTGLPESYAHGYLALLRSESAAMRRRGSTTRSSSPQQAIDIGNRVAERGPARLRADEPRLPQDRQAATRRPGSR